MAGKNETNLLKGHGTSPHPNMEQKHDKPLSSVKGNSPHHHDVRARDGYTSKGLNPKDALSVTKAR
jgi:hypothetical protein